MQVRPFDDRDENAVWGMLEPVFRAGDTYAIDPGISRADAIGYWTAYHAYVAELERELVGTFYIRPNQQGGGAHVCNCGYITAPRSEGRGVARAMLAFSLDEAKRLGFEAMQFNFVLADNTRAVATWDRAGFETIGCIPKAFRRSDGRYADALIMHKSLE